MNRSKAILASLRGLNWLLSTRACTTRPILAQVTHFSRFSPYFLSNQSRSYDFYSTHQKLYFSSKPNSLVDLVLANEWSSELENELEKSIPKMTHETVVYVMKRLDKDPQKAWDFFNWVCDKTGLGLSSSLYCLMLRILANKDLMKQFWITISKMKNQGFYIDRDSYLAIASMFNGKNMTSDYLALRKFNDMMVKENAMDNVVKQLADVILEVEWSDEVVKKLNEMKIELSDNFVMRVLKEMKNYPSKALRFFNWVGQCSSYEHSTITYNSMLRVLARHDSIREFWSFVEEMKNAGHEIDIDTYIKISRHFQKCRMMEDAVKLYELMMDGPYKPSIQDCNFLLRSISANHNQDLNLVFRVSKKYEETGHSLSKAVYDGIHRSLTRVGRFDEAEKIVKVMRNAGYEPDNITYSQLVFGLCKARRFEEAYNVLGEMEAQGCTPDIKTWTILIQGHCAAHEMDKALMYFAKMMEKNFDADADLLDVLINGFLSQNKIDGAYKMLVEMVRGARLRPWQATFKNLIERLLQANKLEDAMNLLVMMKRQNYPPYPEPFVEYISKFGTVEDAAAFLNALTAKQFPSPLAYFHVFQSFFHEGRHFEARDLLYKCPHHIRKDPKISQLFGSAKS